MPVKKPVAMVAPRVKSIESKVHDRDVPKGLVAGDFRTLG
jgi:hypothetical protein